MSKGKGGKKMVNVNGRPLTKEQFRVWLVKAYTRNSEKKNQKNFKKPLTNK